MGMFGKLSTKAHNKALRKASKRNNKVEKKQQRSTREGKKKRRILFICLGVVVLLLCFSWYVIKDNHSVKVTKYSVSHEAVPKSFDGFRILQISDIKGMTFGECQKRLVELINGLEFDMILLTGDYLESWDSDNYYIVTELLESIEADVPVYYILGNDDCENPEKSDKDLRCITENNNKIAAELEKAGAIPVYPMVQIERNGESIYFTGIKYNEKIFDSMNFDSDKCFSICVTHAPVDYNVTKRLAEVNVLSQKEVDFDMIISGHTLGGQVRLPVLGALYDDDRGVLPEETYMYGMHTISGGRISVISSGLGADSGFRLFNTPEVVLIELHSK